MGNILVISVCLYECIPVCMYACRPIYVCMCTCIVCIASMNV